MYGWTHIVLLTDEDTSSTCWSVSQPVDEVIGHDDNYTLTWLRLGSLRHWPRDWQRRIDHPCCVECDAKTSARSVDRIISRPIN